MSRPLCPGAGDLSKGKEAGEGSIEEEIEDFFKFEARSRIQMSAIMVRA